MYEKEQNFLEKCKKALQNGDAAEIKSRFEDILTAYELLLDEAKLMAKTGDRVQKKLTEISDEITAQAELLEEKAEITFKENSKLTSQKNILEEIILQRTAQLFDALQNLEKVSDEYEHFVYRTAHDFMGPVARIKGLCLVAKIEGECKPEYFEMIAENADLLHKISAKLVTAHGIKYHELAEKLINPQEIFENIAAKILINKAAKQLIIEKNSAGIECDVRADAELLEIIFSSLLEFIYANINSKHHFPRLNFNIIYLESEVNIFFEYTGLQIGTHKNEDIFKIFNRISESKDVLGVELYTAKQAAQKMNAELDLVFSNENETIFLLKIHR
jgi:light-regulated signal transduction histidine kinase (bacteriophytochrome)